MLNAKNNLSFATLTQVVRLFRWTRKHQRKCQKRFNSVWSLARGILWLSLNENSFLFSRAQQFAIKYPWHFTWNFSEEFTPKPASLESCAVKQVTLQPLKWLCAKLVQMVLWPKHQNEEPYVLEANGLPLLKLVEATRRLPHSNTLFLYLF